MCQQRLCAKSPTASPPNTSPVPSQSPIESLADSGKEDEDRTEQQIAVGSTVPSAAPTVSLLPVSIDPDADITLVENKGPRCEGSDLAIESGHVGVQTMPTKNVDEGYVVVSDEQPSIPALIPPSRCVNDFCGNLGNMAETLEQLAAKLVEQFPQDALALLLRALGLLERALNVTVSEEVCAPLRGAFVRMLEAAERTAHEICNSSCYGKEICPPARPNSVIFGSAVQQARDAAVALSKGHEAGDWEPVHRRLTLSLMLLDLLASEADGGDIATIESYTTSIKRIIKEVECLWQSEQNK